MALILIFHNDGTGKFPTTGNYNVQIQINDRIIETGRLEGHLRVDGWEVLVQKYLDGRKNETK